jgi:hypothetical protein
LQISAANLLVAGQQPVRQPAAQAPFAPATSDTAAAKAEFVPLDFKRATEQPASTSPPGQSAAPQSRTPQRPGSQLDIRV